MRYLILAVLCVVLVGSAFGQQGPYSSIGGFGNVLYPGTGHAPHVPPGGITGPNFPHSGPGAPLPVFGAPARVNHPQHSRSVIVPYPVYYGGYSGYPGYDAAAYPQEQAPPMVNTNPAPSVVINQNFIPQQANPVIREYAPSDGSTDQQSGMRMYQAPPSHPYPDVPESSAAKRRAAGDDRPTIYLIAFKDHSIVQALGYWMEGSALHYVSVEHTLNQASLDLIDRDLSQRLNDERGVEFKIPAH